MTTTVTIDAHAGWPVEVKQIYLVDGEPVNGDANVITVAPGEVRSFFVHSTMRLEIAELARDTVSHHHGIHE